MSKGFGKKALLHNKKGCKTNSNNNTGGKANTTSEEDDKLMVKFVFEGEKFHARTPIMFEQLTLCELLKKIALDMTLPPPSANELFETYFKEDIYPYIRHNIQSQIRNKRDITKLWDLQSIILQKIYEERAELLRLEWVKLRKQSKNALKIGNNNILDENESELLRKKAELKAKNKANKQKWKDQIAMQIASGQFDEPEPKKKAKEDDAKSHRKKKKDQKKNKSKSTKPNKPIKKKKLKKWKDKKTKKQPEWPGIVKQMPIVQNNMLNSNKKSAAQQLKENLKKLEQINNAINVKQEDRKLIWSELKYRLVIRGQHGECVMQNQCENDNKQMELIKSYIENKNNDVLCIKIWIYMCEIQIQNEKEEIWLNTDKEEVRLSVNKCKLFEILWNDFGNAIKRRIDENNINVVFVKKTKMLRVKIPILSL